MFLWSGMYIGVCTMSEYVKWNMKLFVELGYVPFKSIFPWPENLNLEHHDTNASGSCLACIGIHAVPKSILFEPGPVAQYLLETIQHLPPCFFAAR